MFRSFHLFALVVMLALVGCATPATPTSAPVTVVPVVAPTPTSAKSNLNVLATETFIADIAQNVAGERVKVSALLPIGVDPHAFEPTPNDVKRVADSNILIANGAGFEDFLDKLLKNAGGSRTLIEAATGLTSRKPKESESPAMSDADIADAICANVGNEKPQAALSGKAANNATALPAQEGAFDVALTKQADGTFAGYVKFKAHDEGDNHIAIAAGKIAISAAKDNQKLAIEKSVALKCGGLVQGNIVELEHDTEYVLALTGFKTDKARLAIGSLGGHQHAGDPHFWFDPNYVVQYVENIRDGLSKADPAGAPTYATNATAYIAKLKQLDQSIAEQVKVLPVERRLLVTDHDTFGYFADRYGFRVVGMIVPSVSTGASPSAQQVARLVQQIKAARAKAIFLEASTSPQLAQQIAKETGAKVVAGLHTHSITDANGTAPNYLAMMQFNVKLIVDSLK
ncbi:MAG: zinc ABC transporter substrate-binding protein [Chloroflexi bacterium]|nr:zinc ABC transporter substrate-binding protein [Chloroflexota bacterium]